MIKRRDKSRLVLTLNNNPQEFLWIFYYFYQMNWKKISSTIILFYILFLVISTKLFLNIGITLGTLMEFSVIPLLIITFTQLILYFFLWRKDKFIQNSNFYAFLLNLLSFLLLTF